MLLVDVDFCHNGKKPLFVHTTQNAAWHAIRFKNGGNSEDYQDTETVVPLQRTSFADFRHQVSKVWTY